MRSIRWKMVLMALVVVFIPIYLLNRYAIQYFDRYTRTDFESNLRHYAEIIGEFYKLELRRYGETTPDKQYRDEVQQMLTRVAGELDARVRLLARDGSIIFSSLPHDRPVRDRSEVQAALRGGYSARSRLTPDNGRMYYYIALPVKDAQKHMLGVVYIVAHTGPIIRAILHMVRNQRLATYTALAWAGIVALILALTMTRRLRRLMRETRDFAAGRKPLGPPPRGGDEIAELGRAVHRMAAEIEERNVYNRDFVQTTLHELKTPLTAIRGAVDMLGELLTEQNNNGATSPEEKEVIAGFLARIERQTGRLMQLAGDLRELTRVDVDLQFEERTKIDYARFVVAFVDDMRNEAGRSHAALVAEVPVEPLFVEVVPGRIEQVLANLLDNALRYTPATGRIVVRVRTTGETVITEVEDNGCGIAPSNLSRVFERFFTTERAANARDYGSGLGLAIAAGIIRAHHGSIGVQSEVGRGAMFHFELPMA